MSIYSDKLNISFNCSGYCTSLNHDRYLPFMQNKKNFFLGALALGMLQQSQCSATDLCIVKAGALELKPKKHAYILLALKCDH